MVFFFFFYKHVQQQQVPTGCFTSGMGTESGGGRTAHHGPEAPPPPHPGDRAPTASASPRITASRHRHSPPAAWLNVLYQQTEGRHLSPGGGSSRTLGTLRVLTTKGAALFPVHRVLFTAGYHMMTKGRVWYQRYTRRLLTLLYHTQVPSVMLATLTLELPSYLSIMFNKLLLHVFHTFSSFPLTLVIKFSLPNSCFTWCWVDPFLFSNSFHCAFHMMLPYVWLNYSASLTRQTCRGSWNDFHTQVWISFSVLLVIYWHAIHFLNPMTQTFRLMFLIFPESSHTRSP